MKGGKLKIECIFEAAAMSLCAALTLKVLQYGEVDGLGFHRLSRNAVTQMALLFTSPFPT